MVQEIYQSQIHTQHAHLRAPDWRQAGEEESRGPHLLRQAVLRFRSQVQEQDGMTFPFCQDILRGRGPERKFFTFGRIASSGGYDVFMEGPMRNAFSWGGYLFCAHVLLSCFLFFSEKTKRYVQDILQDISGCFSGAPYAC